MNLPMNKFFSAPFMLAACAALLVACSKSDKKSETLAEGTTPAIAAEAEVRSPQSDAEKLAYSLGYSSGEQLTEYPDLPMEFLTQGLSAGYSAAEPAIPLREMQSRVLEARRLAGERRQAEREQRAAERTQKAQERAQQGRDWLAANATKEGVQVTDSGLQYLVIEGGDGDKPNPTSRVTVHYTGTLIDGTKFDSSYDRNRPATFVLSNVITGWQEGLQLMSAGDTYRFFIPSELAYGVRGSGRSIGPNEALIFEVELISFE